MAEQFGEKVHDPTPHRREEARKKGNIPKSQDLGAAIILTLSTAMMIWLGHYSMNYLVPFFTQNLGTSPPIHIDASDALNIWMKALWVIALVTVPLLLVLFAAAVAANILQVGILFLPDKLQFDLSRLDPIKGLGRIFSIQSVMRLGFGFFKILIVFGIAIYVLWANWGKIQNLYSQDVPQIANFMVMTILWFAFYVALALLLLALLDYAFQKWKHEQDLRMTDQELREELKQMQGDPQVAARRRQVQRQLASSRTGSAVPTADTTITNPTELAVSIKYDPSKMKAPIVVAKGAGHLAQRIRKISLENNVPVVERKELAQALYRDVEIDQPVPTELYTAVAEVLRYVYELQGKKLPEATP